MKNQGGICPPSEAPHLENSEIWGTPKGLSETSARRVSLLDYLHRRRIVPATVRLHDNLDILIERHQEAQQSLDGELAELAAQHIRHIGLADSEQISGFHLFEAAAL